jgi:hypothetical protein
VANEAATAMEVDTAEDTSVEKTKPKEPEEKGELLPEQDIYLTLLVLVVLLDRKEYTEVSFKVVSDETATIILTYII